MSPATAHPVSSPQSVLPIMAAGDQDLDLCYNFLQSPTHGEIAAATFSSLLNTAETLPVEAVSSASGFPSSSVTTCASISSDSYSWPPKVFLYKGFSFSFSNVNSRSISLRL